MDIQEERIKEIIQEWFENGNSASDAGLPACPGFVYRRDGTWKGWNVFLNIKRAANPAIYDEHVNVDRLEDIAFARVQIMNAGTA